MSTSTRTNRLGAMCFLKNSLVFFAYSLFFTLIPLTSACKDEQKLYSYKEEPASEAPASQPAGQQTGATELPPGHPPIESLPAGHPPLDSMAGGMMAAAGEELQADAPPADRARLDAEIPVQEVEIVGVRMTIPEIWESAPPANSMRAAQFTLPAPDFGPQTAELVVFFFGPPPGGGSVSSNLNRWMGQIESSEDTPPVVYSHQRDGLTISELICHGTLKPSGMGTGPTEPQPDSLLYGIIVEGGPEGTLFIKITGPAATIEAANPAIVTMIDSMQGKAEE